MFGFERSKRRLVGQNGLDFEIRKTNLFETNQIIHYKIKMFNLFEIIFDLFIFNVLTDTSDKNFLDRLAGIWIVASLTRCGAFGFNLE